MICYQDFITIAQYVIMGFAIVVAIWMLIRLWKNQMKIRAFSRLEKKIFSSSLILVAIIVGGCIYISDMAANSIIVNEICSNNDTMMVGEHEEICDYIELYNSGALPCRLDEFYVSDDRHSLQKLELIDVVISAGEYVTIPLDGKAQGFGLDKNGETVYLSYKDELIAEVKYPELEKDMAYSRVEEKENQWKLMEGTPGKVNNGTIVMINTPEFSHEGGFYDEPFFLELSSAEDTQIYYTLDGSKPTTESNLYEESIWVYNRSEQENVYRSIKNVIKDWKNHNPDLTLVDKAFIIRAIAIDEMGNQSDVITKTFFVELDEYKNQMVVSLVAEPEELFGADGLYVTGKDYDEWYTSGQIGNRPLANFENSYEKEASLELFNGGRMFVQNVGIQIQGGSSRDAVFKRFNIYARKEYSGDNVFDKNIFEHKDTHSFVLRDVFADAFTQELCEDRHVAAQDSIPAVLFLNGEYWYDTYIVEKYSRTYFEVEYGIDNDNILIAKNGVVKNPQEGDQELLDEVYTYLDTHYFTTEEEYAEFSKLIDTQSYIDFMCINAYLCNMDVDENKNFMMWRVREPSDTENADGKWRWMLYDMDCIEWNDPANYGVAEAVMIDTFSMPQWTADGAYNKQYLYRNMKRIPSFCKQFVLTFMDLINSVFEKENVAKKLAEYGEDLTWNNSFFLMREQYIVPYLAQEFKLSGTIEEVQLTINNADYGYVMLNTITPDLSEGEWSGKYFTDYPITLTAVAKPGYEFVGWTGNIESSEDTIEVEVTAGGVQIHAEYRKKD